MRQLLNNDNISNLRTDEDEIIKISFFDQSDIVNDNEEKETESIFGQKKIEKQFGMTKFLSKWNIHLVQLVVCKIEVILKSII